MLNSVFLMNFSVTTFIIILTIPLSKGSIDANYTVCSAPYSCGKIQNIGYPFWGGDRPAFCGRQEFQLSCQNEGLYPQIQIGISGYSKASVLSINYSTRTMALVEEQYLRTHPSCWVVEKESLNMSSNFKFSSSVGHITLFDSCNSSVVATYQAKSITCSSDQNHTKDSLYYFGKQADVGRIKKSCNSSVVSPVYKSELDELNKGIVTLLSVLKKGFEIEYIANFTSCSICMDSGGKCGSSGDPSQKFVCQCKNGPQPIACRQNSDKANFGLIMGLAIGGGILVLVALVAICYCKKIGRSKHMSRSLSLDSSASEFQKGSIYFGMPLFSYSELKEATGNFDHSRELGSGGFGTVYKGKLKDGREVAVKRLFEKSYKRVEQFMNEVRILTCLRHHNLVSLYGCTSPHSKELLLVYEYVPNGTVADHLYLNEDYFQPLPWSVRLRIAIETANALSYLHASDIIHRDVKTNNILLDSNFSVKVADFGLSRLFPNEVSHVSTAPQGTPGYLDPEYHQCYQLTDKSDVYSFGVLLVELISSLPAVDMNRQRHEINLSNYAMNRIQRCAFDELVDPELDFASDSKVRRMTTSVAELAFQCLQHDKDFRPSMEEILESLKRIESIEYEALGTEETVKIDVENANPSSSPPEDDVVKLLSNHQLSPTSVVKTWSSSSASQSTSS